MSRAIDDLKNEHEAIMSALSIFDKIIAGINVNDNIMLKEITDILRFLHEFFDTCHFSKEEDILFPEMIDAGVSKDDSPIHTMLAEHDLGRQLIRKMADSITVFKDYGTFILSAKKYIELFRSHILQENNILFLIADNVLSKPRLDEIHNRFEEFEKSTIGKNKHEELNTILQELKSKYLN
jgi:hemerythrin-like domain-containing protein